MCRSTTTTTQLLDSLKDESNQAVWADLDARFRPIIHGMSMRLGLSPDDASDVAQATMMAFVRDFRGGKYDRSKGRLRAWLKTIARHRTIDLLRIRARLNEQQGEAAAFAAPSEERTHQAWDAEEETTILHAALHELRETTMAEPTTLKAFELTALHGLSHDAAAVECGMNVAQIRIAKHRLMDQLRAIVERLTKAYQTDD